MMNENTPTVFAEFLLCHHGQIFQDAETGKKERLTIVDISYIADGRKKGTLWLKPLTHITDIDANILGFTNAERFVTANDNNYHIRFELADTLRKLGYETWWRGVSIEKLISRGWLTLYSH